MIAVPACSADDAAGAERVERLLQDGLAVGVAAPLLHVRKVGLVRLVLRRGRRVVGVLTGREPAPGAVPGLRRLDPRLLGEAGLGLVPVGAPVGDAEAWSRVAALRLTHRACADTTAADGVTTGHRWSSCALGPRAGCSKTVQSWCSRTHARRPPR